MRTCVLSNGHQLQLQQGRCKARSCAFIEMCHFLKHFSHLFLYLPIGWDSFKCFHCHIKLKMRARYQRDGWLYWNGTGCNANDVELLIVCLCYFDSVVSCDITMWTAEASYIKSNDELREVTLLRIWISGINYMRKYCVRKFGVYHFDSDIIYLYFHWWLKWLK